MASWTPVLLSRVTRPNSEKIRTYLQSGGYGALRKALTMSPDQIIAEVKASGLRGRGGAGFPTGMKWGFIPREAPVKYLAVNTDEGEPGTFKDRLIVERDPHSIVEGVIIAAYAIGARRAFVYIRGEFFLGVKRWIGDLQLLRTLETVAAGRGTCRDLTKLEELTRGSTGTTFCPMGTGMCEPVSSGLNRLRSEFMARTHAN